LPTAWLLLPIAMSLAGCTNGPVRLSDGGLHPILTTDLEEQFLFPPKDGKVHQVDTLPPDLVREMRATYRAIWRQNDTGEAVFGWKPTAADR
jgi:hypothetical protein